MCVQRVLLKELFLSVEIDDLGDFVELGNDMGGAVAFFLGLAGREKHLVFVSRLLFFVWMVR